MENLSLKLLSLTLIVFLITLFTLCDGRGISKEEDEWNLRQLIQDLEKAKSDILKLKKQVKEQDEKLSQVRSVPSGFIYMQLPKQPSPTEIWENTVWEEITSNYTGMFFRALGGDAAPWGEVQQDNCPKITEVQSEMNFASQSIETKTAYLTIGGWSNPLWTGDDVHSYFPHYLIRTSFFTSGGEVRPKNVGIKIWKAI